MYLNWNDPGFFLYIFMEVFHMTNEEYWEKWKDLICPKPKEEHRDD